MSKVKVSKGELEAEVEYDFGAAYASAAEEVKISIFRQAATVTLQANLRRALVDGANSVKLQAIADSWVPGTVTRVRRDPKERIVEAYQGMSSEERKELIAQLKAASKAE